MDVTFDSLPTIQTLDDFEAETASIVARPFVSKFGAVGWRDVPVAEEEYAELVEGLIPEGGIAMLAGASQSGKTFVALDLAMSIVLGKPWFGKDVAQGGVIYFAAEDPRGVRSLRIPAYAQEFGLSYADDLPFALLTQRLNIWETPERAGELIEEVKGVSSGWRDPLKLVVIDTLAKATIGSDELSAKDMNIIMDRCERIVSATGATVLLVDHLNANGARVRGVGSKTANIDSVLICRPVMEPGSRKGEQVIAKDDDGRKLREITNDVQEGGKVKNGSPLDQPLRFVLRGVQLGHYPNGKPKTSCVIGPPSGGEIASRDNSSPAASIGAKLSLAMRSLRDAIEAKGRGAPADVPGAPHGPACVTLTDWRDYFAPLIAEEREPADRLEERSKKARDKAAEVLIGRGYIRKHGDWVWRTTRKVPGLDRIDPPRRREDPLPPLPRELTDDEIPF